MVGKVRSGWNASLVLDSELARVCQIPKVGVPQDSLVIVPNVSSEPEEDEFVHLDPDDCPSLQEAAKILFPNLCRQIRAEGPEVTYESEMLARISEVGPRK